MRVIYSQLDADLLTVLNARLAALGGNRAALAREIGVSRSAISQALDGRYPGDTRRLAARITAQLVEAVTCPALHRDIPPADCEAYRSRPLSACTASREAVKHWQACQACPQNPGRRGAIS
jgi:DNA-binding transcriptional regulator YdaS (Cro superfamily)